MGGASSTVIDRSYQLCARLGEMKVQIWRTFTLHIRGNATPCKVLNGYRSLYNRHIASKEWFKTESFCRLSRYISAADFWLCLGYGARPTARRKQLPGLHSGEIPRGDTNSGVYLLPTQST